MQLYKREIKPQVLSFVFPSALFIEKHFISNQITHMHIYIYKMAVNMSFSKGHNQMGTASDNSAAEHVTTAHECPRINLLLISDFRHQPFYARPFGPGIPRT